jgi:hypothetical protein
MKTALIRVLAIATLASSMSAFAATEDTKRDDAATVATSTKQQDGCPENAGHGKKQQKAKTQRDDQKEKELDRLLMGIYG